MYKEVLNIKEIKLEELNNKELLLITKQLKDMEIDAGEIDSLTVIDGTIIMVHNKEKIVKPEKTKSKDEFEL